jgi:hypothetical protein
VNLLLVICTISVFSWFSWCLTPADEHIDTFLGPGGPSPNMNTRMQQLSNMTRSATAHQPRTEDN